MEIKALALALIAGLNGMVEHLEKAISADGDSDGDDDAPPASRRKKRVSRKAKDETEDDDKDDDGDGDGDGDGDAPSEDDIIDAVRAAQKVLEKDDVVKIIRKYGKCDRASQVPEERRQAVMDALEKAVDAAA